MGIVKRILKTALTIGLTLIVVIALISILCYLVNTIFVWGLFVCLLIVALGLWFYIGGDDGPGYG